jgi:hypothetical protein
MEFRMPELVPADLGPSIEWAFWKAQRDFPEVEQFEGRITAALFAFADIVCKAAEDDKMPVGDAHKSLGTFLNTLVNNDLLIFRPEPFAFTESLKDKIRQSPEFLRYLERLDQLAKPRATKVEETTKIQELRSAKESEGFVHSEDYRSVTLTSASGTTEAADPAGPRARVEAFIARFHEETGQNINRKAIWIAAGYADQSELQRYQRGCASKVATEKFNRILSMGSTAFIRLLDKAKKPPAQ